MLGSTGPMVSAQGLGCMGMSHGYGAGDETESLAVLRRALELGVTFWDTADYYAAGANEALLAKVLAEHRSEVVLATKFGLVADANSAATQAVRGDAGYVRSACEASLRRLKTDVIDLYYQHRVDVTVPIEETVGAMAELVTAGKVRHLGLSEATASELRRAAAVHPIAAVQSEWSLWSRDVEESVVPACHELGVGFVPYSPLGRGFLTGTLSPVEELPADDIRRSQPRLASSVIDTNLALVGQVRQVAADLGVAPAQVALSWVHHRQEVWELPVIPIPGTKRIRWLEQNVAALDIRLPSEALDRLDRLAAMAVGDRHPQIGLTSAGGRA
ncbi:MAG TPA: aldo/keto reductase [Jiangellaceae bacterium]|nr:aldo/keto reductase [Jiangellaceae bacterium]